MMTLRGMAALLAMDSEASEVSDAHDAQLARMGVATVRERNAWHELREDRAVRRAAMLRELGADEAEIEVSCK